MGQQVGTGDKVRHRESGKTGTVTDLTQLMSDDDRTPHGLAVMFTTDDGQQVRCLATEVDVLQKGVE